MLQILGLCSLGFGVATLYLFPRFSDAVLLLCSSAGFELDCLLSVEFPIWCLGLFFVGFYKLYVNLCMHMCILPQGDYHSRSLPFYWNGVLDLQDIPHYYFDATKRMYL